MTKEAILNLIQQSFLSDDQKRELVAMVNNGTDEKKILDTFNAYLIDEVNKRTEKHKNLVKKFDDEADLLEKEISNKKEVLASEVERKLSSIDPTDLKNKERIWDEYYKNLDDLQVSSEEKLKQKTAMIIMEI